MNHHRVKHIHFSVFTRSSQTKMMQKVDGMFLPFCGLNQRAGPTLTGLMQHVKTKYKNERKVNIQDTPVKRGNKKKTALSVFCIVTLTHLDKRIKLELMDVPAIPALNLLPHQLLTLGDGV